MTYPSFEALFATATGHVEAAGVLRAPYRYQARIADEGLPEVLAVPTGTGKTAAAVLPWLWRRRFHPDTAVRTETPHWLVVCLPMRVLTEQTERSVKHWLRELGLSEQVLVHVVMGGEASGGRALRDHPDRDAVLIGTLDMLLSRALNRGFGASRASWPIDFGLLHNGCHWVFDEVQLMGPALETSRQLAGFRRELGVVLPTSSTWMSATVPPERLLTVDNDEPFEPLELTEEDVSGPLHLRLGAVKTLVRLSLDPKDERKRATELARALTGAHRPGTLTIAVHNTIKSARATYAALVKLGAPSDAHLLHSRFRPDDRRRIEEAAIEAPLGGAGRIVVTTQVLEAGVDVSAEVLFTEAAPWPSIVQRAGRCNRDGLAEGARLLWAPPIKSAPYEADDVDASTEALIAMEGTAQTVTTLRDTEVATKPVFHPVLRKVDLLGLFDTTPDLTGNDLDISAYLRPGDDHDVSVAWRELPSTGPGGDDPAPRHQELCSAPIHEVRELVKKGNAAWIVDHLRRRREVRWRRLDANELKPGMVVLFSVEAGCYTREGGWDPASRAKVEPVPSGGAEEVNLVEAAEEGDEDRLSVGPGWDWYPLADHLADVEREVEVLARRLAPRGPAPLVRAAAVAGRLHDIGKVHPVFQSTLERTAANDLEAAPAGAGPWAKSGGSNKPRHERRGFCHELASALALMSEGSVVLAGEDDADLIRYLVAAHHGRIRMGIRALPDERTPSDLPTGTRIARGIVDGEGVPSTLLPDGSRVPASVMDLTTMQLGRAEDGSPSWTERALALRDRDDLGPFRLAWLEALVRLADWRASAAAKGGPK